MAKGKMEVRVRHLSSTAAPSVGCVAWHPCQHEGRMEVCVHWRLYHLKCTYLLIYMKGGCCICAFTRMTDELFLLRERVNVLPNSSLPLHFSPVDGRWFRFFCFFEAYWQLAAGFISSLPPYRLQVLQPCVMQPKLPVAFCCLCAPKEFMETRLKQVYIASDLLDS